MMPSALVKVPLHSPTRRAQCRLHTVHSVTSKLHCNQPSKLVHNQLSRPTHKQPRKRVWKQAERCRKFCMGAQATTEQAPVAANRGTFKQLVAASTGPSFRSVARIIEVPWPMLGENEVLVRVEYAGINGGHETFQARGEFAFSRLQDCSNFPLGAEGCGTVVEVGPGVTDLKVGQAVAVNHSHCFAEYVVSKPRSLYPVAKCVPEVAALTLSGVVACAALESTARIQAGEVVLVTAAAGGTGHLAVQLARLAGCKVVATCGSEEKKRALMELGVDRVVNYKQEDLHDVLSAEYPGGVNVVYECVGGTLLNVALQHLAPGARLLQVGYISRYPHTGLTPDKLVLEGSEGSALPTSAEELFWGKQVVRLGDKTLYGNIWPKDLRSIMSSRRRVFDLWESGQLKVLIDQSHRLEGLASTTDAVEHMLKGQNVGKVVLRVSQQ